MKKIVNYMSACLTVILMVSNYVLYKLNIQNFEILFYSINSIAIVLACLTAHLNVKNIGERKNPSMQDYANNIQIEASPILHNPENAAEEKGFENILNEIIFSMQTIEISARALSNPMEPELQFSASRLITNEINHIKKIIGLKTYNKTEEEENFIPFDLKNIPIKQNISESISIGIYGKKDAKTEKLNMILQSYGFFVRLSENSQEILSLIEGNLIHMLIILPENEEDESFRLCEIIRQKYSLLDFSILVLVNKYRSYLIEKSFSAQINDFLIRPFDLSALLARIQILANYQNLYYEKQELLKSEKEKRTFLYFVTHNVNTPLTILLNEMQALSDFSKGLTAGKEGQDTLPEIVKNLTESANQINLIIQNVLNSYKISDGRLLINPAVINLKEYLSLENTFLAEKAGVKKQAFTFECLTEKPCVFCDINSLKGIYTNLIDNAIKYTPLGGHIKSQISNDKDYIYLKIIDDGQGIPKEKQIVLFDRFANIGSMPTFNEKSLGLGLYVVNEICKLNNLELEYSENKGADSGSIFTIRFSRIS